MWAVLEACGVTKRRQAEVTYTLVESQCSTTSASYFRRAANGINTWCERISATIRCEAIR